MNGEFQTNIVNFRTFFQEGTAKDIATVCKEFQEAVGADKFNNNTTLPAKGFTKVVTMKDLLDTNREIGYALIGEPAEKVIALYKGLKKFLGADNFNMKTERAEGPMDVPSTIERLLSKNPNFSLEDIKAKLDQTVEDTSVAAAAGAISAADDMDLSTLADAMDDMSL